MKKLITTIAAASALTLLSSPLYAAELKVGIVNMNVVIQKSALMASINEGLIKQFQDRQKELADAQKQLQDENNQLTVNAANMTNDDRNKLQVKIATDQANVQILTASLQRDVAIAKDAAMQKFSTQLNHVIQNLAQNQHYDMIEQSTNYLYIKSNFDITQEVVNQLK